MLMDLLLDQLATKVREGRVEKTMVEWIHQNLASLFQDHFVEPKTDVDIGELVSVTLQIDDSPLMVNLTGSQSPCPGD